MRPPLPNGTVLQNRYRLLSVLGQGGFGRTYLAENQGRFNELCVLKELIPPQSGGYALEKSEELFQREAETLYQIQHPQIPRFWENFKQDQRFFLVQEYVQGETYRAILDRRKTQGFNFTEDEVKQLLVQLLPVLTYIHGNNIIHRDIAPDNVILREKDRLPVLIDFGVVKDLATRIHTGTVPQANTAPQGTTVGKLGYSPSEQMQTGRAYPSSDLYSLAVTAVVLLTGKEPQDLFDDNTLTWYWQRWATIDPGFAQVLNRMLSYRPGDRYGSAAEVLQVLQSGASPAPQSASAPSAPTVAPSNMATMAVGRSPEPTANRRSASDPVIPPPARSLWDDPWAVAVIGTALVLLTGVGSWAIVRSVLNRPPEPIPTQTAVVPPSPTPTVTASATPTPKPTPKPETNSELIEVPIGTGVTKSGTLKANQTIIYTLSSNQRQALQQGQQLQIFPGGDQSVQMSVFDQNGAPLGSASKGRTIWQETLPRSGFYSVRLTLAPGFDTGKYQLDINLREAVQPSPSPTPTVTPSIPAPPTPTIETQALNFPAGSTVVTVANQSGPTVTRRYTVQAGANKVLSAKVVAGDVVLTVRNAQGEVIQGAEGVTVWESKLAQGGSFQIDVQSPQASQFQLEVGLADSP
jgi:serine/threonine protein kinase